MKFSGIMLGSENPKVLGEFYKGLLGAPGFEENDWYGWSEGAGLMIGGHSEVHGKNEAPSRILLTLEVEDVPAAYQECLTAGATSIAEPYHPGGNEAMWLATVADPDGNYVQLARPWQ